MDLLPDLALFSGLGEAVFAQGRARCRESLESLVVKSSCSARRRIWRDKSGRAFIEQERGRGAWAAEGITG